MKKKIIKKLFFKKHNKLLFVAKEKIFSEHIMSDNPTTKQEKMIEDIRTLSKLKKEQNYTAIKRYKKAF